MLTNTLKNPWMDFTACRGFKKPLQKRRFARALLEQNGLRKARRDFLNILITEADSNIPSTDKQSPCHNAPMQSAWRWSRKALELARQHPAEALKAAGLFLIPNLFWGAIFYWLNFYNPFVDYDPLSRTGANTAVSLVLGALAMPLVSAAYGAYYGFTLDGRLNARDYFFGLQKPVSAVLSFWTSVLITIVGMGFIGGASVVWALPVLAVSEKPFPHNLRLSIGRGTQNITTLLHAMGVMVWLLLLALGGIGLFSVCLLLLENAGEHLGLLMVILSPLLLLAWLMFPFAMLTHCVGVRDELGLQQGPFAGRLKRHEEKKERQRQAGRVAAPRPSGLKAANTLLCQVCGEEVPREARFCPECRSPIQGPAATN